MVSLGFNHQHNRPKPPSIPSLEGSQHHHFSTYVLVYFMGLVGVEDFAAPPHFPRQLYHILYHHFSARSRLHGNTLLFHRQWHRRHIRNIRDCLFSIPDILARALGARRRVVANAPAERIGEQSSTAIVPSPARPPPPYCHIPDFQRFPSSLVKSSLSMAEVIV